MNMNRYHQYKTQSVLTMTPEEMLLLLYDELVKRLTRAEFALEKKEYEVFESSIKRCVEIVQYLKDTLNYQYSISQELRQMYDFYMMELSRVSAGRNKEVIKELMPLIKDLRDTFQQAAKLA